MAKQTVTNNEFLREFKAQISNVLHTWQPVYTIAVQSVNNGDNFLKLYNKVIIATYPPRRDAMRTLLVSLKHLMESAELLAAAQTEAPGLLCDQPQPLKLNEFMEGCLKNGDLAFFTRELEFRGYDHNHAAIIAKTLIAQYKAQPSAASKFAVGDSVRVIANDKFKDAIGTIDSEDYIFDWEVMLDDYNDRFGFYSYELELITPAQSPAESMLFAEMPDNARETASMDATLAGEEIARLQAQNAAMREALHSIMGIVDAKRKSGENHRLALSIIYKEANQALNASQPQGESDKS